MNVKYDEESKLQQYYNDTIKYFDSTDWKFGNGLINASITGNGLIDLLKYLNVDVNGKKILDFGCGIGFTSIYLTSLFNCNCIGVDYSEERIKIALKNSNPNCDFFVDDVNYWLDSINDVFDVILAFEIIEHLVHPEKVVSKLKTKLSHDGILIGTLPYQKIPGGPHLSAFLDKDDVEQRLNVKILDKLIDMRFDNQNIFIWKNI